MRRCLAGSFEREEGIGSNRPSPIIFSPFLPSFPFLLLSQLSRQTTTYFPSSLLPSSRVEVPNIPFDIHIEVNPSEGSWVSNASSYIDDRPCKRTRGFGERARLSGEESREREREAKGVARCTLERFRSRWNEVFARRIPIHGSEASANIDFQLPYIFVTWRNVPVCAPSPRKERPQSQGPPRAALSIDLQFHLPRNIPTRGDKGSIADCFFREDRARGRKVGFSMDERERRVYGRRCTYACERRGSERRKGGGLKNIN